MHEMHQNIIFGNAKNIDLRSHFYGTWDFQGILIELVLSQIRIFLQISQNQVQITPKPPYRVLLLNVYCILFIKVS